MKHNVGEDLQELLHLELGWLLMRLQELGLHRRIDFGGDMTELGRHEQGVIVICVQNLLEIMFQGLKPKIS